ncbi:unnamed protein product [Diplocarpon coronariae]
MRKVNGDLVSGQVRAITSPPTSRLHKIAGYGLVSAAETARGCSSNPLHLTPPPCATCEANGITATQRPRLDAIPQASAADAYLAAAVAMMSF